MVSIMSIRLHLLVASGTLGLLPYAMFVDTAADAAPALIPSRSTTHADPTDTQDKVDPMSAKACSACHQTIYDEWKAAGQMHSNAWLDQLYQAKIQKKKRPKTCYACHIPERVLARVGRKPKTRKGFLHEGVTCVACHESDGKMHGPFDCETTAHATEKNPLFTPQGSNALCNSCHKTKIDVVLPVGKDFEKSGLEAKGKSCIGCHMPEVEQAIANEKGSDKPAGIKRKGRSHKILGPNDAKFCAKAFKLSVAKAEGRVVLTIENTTGHRVPGLLIRSFRFSVKQLDADGKVLANDDCVVDGDNQLPVLEKRQVPLKVADGVSKVEVLMQHYFLDKLVAEIKKTTLKL